MSNRKKLIVLHGWGGTFADAVACVRDLLDFKVDWRDGVFFVDRRVGSILRNVLSAPADDPFMRALQELAISRFLSASVAATHSGIDRDRAACFPESRLLRDFGAFGIPLLPGARDRRASQLREAACRTLDSVMPVLDKVGAEIVGREGARLTEAASRTLIHEQSGGVRESGAFVDWLEAVRDLHESGGDLDTVASAAFYVHALRSSAAGRFRHGVDFEYVFVNYHEGLAHLAALGPADVYMADLPIGALPDFEADCRFLREHDVRVARFEDHHPYSAVQKAVLDALVQEGLIGVLHMRGPLRDRELAPADMAAAADIVHESMIEGRPWDTAGAKALRAAAHSEDLVTGRSELGRLLTSLIKGGVCKIELVQLLLDSFAADDALERLRSRGWDSLSASWQAEFEAVADRLNEHTYRIRVNGARPLPDAAGDGSPPTGDRPASVEVLVALAPFVRREEGRVTIGKAQEFYGRMDPPADYLFYCYGSSLLVARRLNQEDSTLNLGVLMESLGGEGDGGHAGAAVCRPDSNASYPDAILGSVSGANFGRFAAYLAHRLEEGGLDVSGVRNTSTGPRGGFRRGSGRKLLFVTLVAVSIGLVLTLLASGYRPSRIAESNRDFFSALPGGMGETPAEPAEEGGP